MSNFTNVLKIIRQRVAAYWNKSPSTKIITLNAIGYMMWKLNIIPEDFMVKHFSNEKYNLQEGRIHTLLTHGFSHTGIFSLAIDLFVLGFVGRHITVNFGAKYVYWLFGFGTIFSGLTASIFQPLSPYIHPYVGSEGALAAYITFIGATNPRATFMMFGLIPMSAISLMLIMAGYSLLADPHKRTFAGMTAGYTIYRAMIMGML